jgi:hypothetical protein
MEWRRDLQYLIYCALLVALCACGTTQPAETLERPDLNGFATQAAEVQLTAQSERVAVDATVQAASLLAQQQLTYNSQLLATVRANEQPTPSERLALSDGGAVDLAMLDTSSGEMNFMQIGMSGYIRPDDGCFESHQQYYAASATSVVYMTGLAVNLREGTTFSVDWFYNGQRVFQSSWTAPSDEVRRCFAVPMRAADVALQAGSWTATLYINGVQRSQNAFEIVQR